MSKLTNAFAGIVSTLFVSSLAFGQANAAGSGRCASEAALQVCVVSAALTGAGWQGEGSDRRGVTVSVSLGISNTTDYPIEIALFTKGWGTWSLTPENAEAIMNEGSWNVSGINECNNVNACGLTTIGAHMSTLVQIRYRGEVSTAGLPLVQVASTASFSETFLVRDRGTVRFVSLPLTGFTFGNALPSMRR